MTVVVPLLTERQRQALPSQARDVVDYRKSGLSLNHIQGCPLDCAYCIRHTYGLWDQRQPRALMSDAEAVDLLVNHRYFRPHITPLQLFNRATDPFLPQVKDHTFAVMEDLDGRGLTNHLVIITRCKLSDGDCLRLSVVTHLRLTVLFTYSGIDDRRIEPYPSGVAAASLATVSKHRPRRYRTVLYWRPLVPGLNDSDEQLARAAALSHDADATVFTGLFFRDQIAAYYQADGLCNYCATDDDDLPSDGPDKVAAIIRKVRALDDCNPCHQPCDPKLAPAVVTAPQLMASAHAAASQ